MSWTKEAIEEAVNKVGARTAIDMEFRKLCVNNMHAAIQQETDLELPASFTIGVLDQSAYQLSIVLPPVAREDGELLESELDQVAGGLTDEVRPYEAAQPVKPPSAPVTYHSHGSRFI